MKQLWAPWRIDYIEQIGSKKKRCALCCALRIKGSKSYIIKRGKTCFTILNKYPYTNGHCMVSPKRHTNKLEKLTQEEQIEIFSMIICVKELLSEAYKPDGFNIGINLGKAAGAGITGHMHFHIVPRWNGDTNFISSIGNTKVLPEALEVTYKRLKNFYKLKLWNGE